MSDMLKLHRRELLGATAAVGTLAVLRKTAAADRDQHVEIIDSNVSLFQWPFRRLPLDETSKLVGKLQSLGITQAWAGSFEGLLHRDLTAVNERLASECGKHAELIPIGAINPMLPGWENDLWRCDEKHRMPGIRLHPSYHGYDLKSEEFVRLMKLATSHRMVVQIAVEMEDPRTQSSLVQVAAVNVSPLAEVMKATPGARVQLLNAKPRGATASQLGAIPGVHFDTARFDGTDGVATLLDAVPEERVLYGSHSPFLIPEAALIRVAESRLEHGPLMNVLNGNAVKLMRAAKR